LLSKKIVRPFDDQDGHSLQIGELRGGWVSCFSPCPVGEIRKIWTVRFEGSTPSNTSGPFRALDADGAAAELAATIVPSRTQTARAILCMQPP